MRKLIIAAVTVAALAVPAVGMADTTGTQASACGAVHGAFASTNGNFGRLGAVGGASDKGTTPPGQAPAGNPNAVASQSC